jgi:DNA polymerase-3 subunit chi
MNMKKLIDTKVIFIKVTTPQIKQRKLCDVIQHHFESGENILITVPNSDAARYVDELLWRLPEESFLPHLIAEIPLEEPIVISTRSENLNNATVVFNLQSGASSLCGQIPTIYELMDETHPDRQSNSLERFTVYQKQGYEPSEKE